MPFMNIPPFPRRIEIPDLENLIRTRLTNAEIVSPDQAIPLVGYMCFPNDKAARGDLHCTVRSWLGAPEGARLAVPPKLRRIQANWLKVADVFHHYCDLVEGEHQEPRGGPSIGKANTLVAAKARSWGTQPATLWKLWSTYKDVAHLATAAALICAETHKRILDRPLPTYGLKVTEIDPFQIVLLMPDFVLAVATEFERRGLANTSNARSDSALDPGTVWRIPDDINVVPFPPPIRKLRKEDIAVLHNRRAGNRGKLRRGSNDTEPPQFYSGQADTSAQAKSS
jgi:hypothetical protein